MSPPRPIADRANGGICKRCPNARPPGRPVYCSDDCAALGAADRRHQTQVRRMAACARCGGPKDHGTRGARYCDECRRLIGDSSSQQEYERGRRRALRDLGARVDAGERIKARKLDTPVGCKWCARCQVFRPESSFPHRKGGGLGAYCKPCQRTYNHERRLRLNFGLTWDEYDQLLADQNFRCAICDGKPRKNVLAVDHDHATGELRGLLCGRCNHRLLGAAHDSPDRLRKAADYLEAFAPRETFGEPRFVPGFGPQVVA